MKKVILILLTVLLAALIALEVYWEPVMDLLGVDQSGWEVREGQSFYLNEKGDPVTGWQEIGGSRYYFDPASGAMCTGWTDVDGKRYCLDENGHITTGWWEGVYLLADGSVATGWQEIDGRTYCFDSSGAPVSGWQDAEGQRCYLNGDGSLYYGWLELDGSRWYLDEQGHMATGWLQTEQGLYYLNEDGTAASGWVELAGVRYYLEADGRCAEGWQEIDGRRYYLNSDGSCVSGWQEVEGRTFYFREDGTMATGQVEIDGVKHWFTSTGAEIILVNPWNYVPEGYEVELVEVEGGHQVAAEMEEALAQMLADCEAAGHKPFLKSSYRTQAHQQMLFNNKVAQVGSREKAATIVAVPGTSEHQLGLAVDITDYNYRTLNYDQEKTETQKWLMEHCWDYGFILRYPNDKSEITGIIYEPWHYRYVGMELAQEMKTNGLCLEEYLDMLTTE